ncbi:branched-chain amino acid ABC transporter substrate-binding protein [Citricoccus zhacaiensis]|uniref:Branched-chain amino acid ABC transporter substrate-binding protein n=1 Tax=Citricoccus zhacaiensis TaxID=489142 RepID=A0ABQ2LVR4_9MICC|nr:ABC transporter substrate-binding protein [Citricoccus zhacaiensis]GGO43650.1 branched-chain amino acid ABC transporter substrate-binding protein [Citricoccus zhacaiensis]
MNAKKKIAYSMSAVALMALVTSCGGTEGGGDAAGGTEGEPIKIAVIPPTSGALAEFGTASREAWEYAAKEANDNGGILGRPVELVIKDTDASANTTLQAVREAVTQDGANFIGGVMTSTEHNAIAQQLEGLNALNFNSNGKDDALTGADCKPNSYRIVQSNLMDINALADSLAELPGETWAIQAVDYSTGHDAAAAFTEAAEAAGKEVVTEQFAPLNTTEFGTYITELKNSGADALFSVEYGADGVAFVNQADQFGLTDQFDTVLGFNMVSEPLFETLGDRIVGFKNNVGYDVNADNESNQSFVEGFEEEYGETPYYVHADNYLAAQTLFAGIEEAGSSETEAVREALKDLSFDSIVGEVTVRSDDNQLLRPSQIGEVVEGEDGELEFEILTTADASVTTPEASDECTM